MNFCLQQQIMGFNCSQDGLGLTLERKLPTSDDFTAQVSMTDGFCGIFVICSLNREIN